MGKIIHYADLRNYLKQIVRNNKALNPDDVDDPKSFVEFESDFNGTKMVSPSFILIPSQYSVEDGNSDNIHLVNRIDFLIVKSGKKGSVELNSQVFGETFEILWDILTQIETDMRKFPLTDRPFREWNKNTIQIDEVPPFNADYFIGHKISFEVKNPRNLMRENSNWYV